MKFTDIKDIKFEDYFSVFKNGGKFIKDEEVINVSLEDALSHESATRFFPMTVETVVREAVEPVLVGTYLLERINYQKGLQMSNPTSVGAMVAEDIGQTGEYPEVALNFGPGASIVTIGKSGIALKFSDDFTRYSNFDMLGIYLKAAGRAMARLKESKIWAMFGEMGVVTHDNLNPGNSIFGVTTGYGWNGSANGSITLEDIYNAYAAILENGFIADTLIVHPLTFTMFLSDPVLRVMALEHGGGAWFNGWNGSGVNQNPFSRGMLGKAGPGMKPASEQSEAEKMINGTMKVPGYLGLPIRIIASPFVPYNKTTKLTDIYFVDSSNIGAIVVDEDVTMVEIPDKLHEITKIKFRERYSILPYNEGNAVGVMKNVKVTPNRMTPPIQPTMASTQSFNPITDPKAAPVV